MSNSSLLPLVGQRNLIRRERWLRQTLAKIPAGSKILDAGAGELQYQKYCSHLRYVSQDFAQYDGSGDGAGLQTKTWDNTKLDIISDITHIPVKPRSFDAIMCIEVLEHIPHPDAAIVEFSRILKKGGQLIITAPFNSITHFAPYHFATGLTQYWYQQVLSENGFIIKQLTKNGNFLESLAQEVRRLEYVVNTYTDVNFSSDPHNQRAVEQLLRVIEKYEPLARRSKELQCYGIHVLAEKK